MKFKTWMLVVTVVAGVFGLALIFVPGTVSATYGVTADVGMRYMDQLFGASLVAIALLCWFAQDAPESEARAAIVRALVIFNGVALVVTLMAQLKGVMNAVGWSAVAIYLLLGLGWATFLRAKPAA
jgi:hypothetical protein